MDVSNPIWQAAEIQSWCRNFDYEGYCNYCKLAGNIRPIDEEGYSALKDVLEGMMERDMAREREEAHGR